MLLFKPKGLERRTRTLILLLLDTGVRITEALTLERHKVNLDDMLITVWGKGAKEGSLPFGHELRPVVFRWLTQGTVSPFVFAARSGARLSYRNAFREIKGLCRRAGVQTHCHPHLFRHQFAANYISTGRRHLSTEPLARAHGHHDDADLSQVARVEELRAGRERLNPLRRGV